MLDHYQETYRVTHRFEYERNRLFVLFILVLIVAIYLALNKEVAQVALDFFAPKSDAAKDALAKVNFYRIFNVISIMAAFYIVVNLHHRYSTIKRNYNYLAKLEHEYSARSSQIKPPQIAFTRESTFYEQNRSSLSKFVRISYSIILISFVMLFLGIRLWSDWPGWPGGRSTADLMQTHYAFDALLFGLDIALGLPILIAVLAYVTLTFRRT